MSRGSPWPMKMAAAEHGAARGDHVRLNAASRVCRLAKRPLPGTTVGAGLCFARADPCGAASDRPGRLAAALCSKHAPRGLATRRWPAGDPPTGGWRQAFSATDATRGVGVRLGRRSSLGQAGRVAREPLRRPGKLLAVPRFPEFYVRLALSAWFDRYALRRGNTRHALVAFHAFVGRSATKALSRRIPARLARCRIVACCSAPHEQGKPPGVPRHCLRRFTTERRAGGASGKAAYLRWPR